MTGFNAGLGICIFAHSLFALCSKSLILKSDRERFAHFALYKRATVCDSIFKKE